MHDLMVAQSPGRKILSSLLLLYNKTGELYDCFKEEMILLFDVASYSVKCLSYRIMVYMCAALLLICHNNVLYNVYNTDMCIAIE